MDLDFRPKKTDRMKKVNELLLHELAQMVQEKTRGKFVTLTHIETAKDLKNATCWVDTLDPQKKEIVILLNESAHEFQRSLGKKLDLRSIPRLYFKLDESGEHAQKIDEILDKEKSN